MQDANSQVQAAPLRLPRAKDFGLVFASVMPSPLGAVVGYGAAPSVARTAATLRAIGIRFGFGGAPSC